MATASFCAPATGAFAGTGTDASPDVAQVTYRGYTVDVPESWPIVRLEEEAGTCVRFDEHVVYLGHPSAQQNCPAHLVEEKQDALLVEPVEGAGVQDPAAVIRSQAGSDITDEQLTNGNQQAQVSVAEAGLMITATYAGDPSVVGGVLRSARIGDDARPGTLPQEKAARALATASVGDDYNGKGFDTCTAPSSGAMSDWSASPYHAVGVYIAGNRRACAQPNLTASWVQRQEAAGWHLMPIHVGEQAATMSATESKSQGRAAAEDTVDAAKALGIPAGSVLYSDIEHYASSSYRGRVLNYLSGWSQQLHKEGFRSGAYVAADGGAPDLASVYGNTAYDRLDVVWTANWNGAANVSDASMALPSSAWQGAHRAHQYAGNVTETYGDTKIQIDRNYVDVAGASAPEAPEVPKAEPTQRVHADFNGDGRDDVAAVYGYDDHTVSVFTFLAKSDGGFEAPVKSWTSQPNYWTFKSVKMTAGDYNGDGRAELAAMYDYADGSVAMFTWPTNTDGTFKAPQKSWTTEPGNWYPKHVQLASGDYDGNGRDDIAAFYGYSDGRAALFTFKGQTDGGFAAPAKSWNVPEAYWWGDNVKFTSGDFNGDGRTDAAAIYGYDDGTVSAFTWIANTNGGFATPTKSWTRPPGNWTFESIKLTSGDYNGNGRDDLAAMYDYADGSAAMFTWLTDADGTFQSPQKSWTTEPGNWYPEHVQLASGDYDGNGRDDIAAFYGYSDARAALFTFKPNTSGEFAAPVKSWNVPADHWWGEHVKLG
ncbi:glycoside hydrolase domain-containing protein [Streptomyces sp. SPB78]|nr:glycoside hydrolase domain-containing protein [Streptomyces sp. SPB78]